MNNEILAENFCKLPFAFSEEKDIRVLSNEILAGKFCNVIELLQQEIHTHQACDNWIKSDVIFSYLKKLKSSMKV
jgi:hypothetical protein